MADRVKRSVSMPPDLDAAIVAAAAREGLTYSAWLARTAAREVTIERGLAAMAEYESEHGAFTDEETAAARRWVDAALAPLEDEIQAPSGAAGAAGAAQDGPPRRRRSTPAA